MVEETNLPVNDQQSSFEMESAIFEEPPKVSKPGGNKKKIVIVMVFIFFIAILIPIFVPKPKKTKKVMPSPTPTVSPVPKASVSPIVEFVETINEYNPEKLPRAPQVDMKVEF